MSFHGRRFMDDKIGIRLLSDFIADKAGSADAFFIRYNPIILSAVGTIRIPLDSWTMKDDLFQEVWMHICKKPRVVVSQWLKEHQAPFERYLFKISRRQALKKLKVGEPTIPDTSQNFDDNEEYFCNIPIESRFIFNVIYNLPPQDQIFIRLDFFCKRPVGELMKVFTMPSANSVYIKRNKIRRNLRTLARRLSQLKSASMLPYHMPFEILEIDGINNDTTIMDIVVAWSQLHQKEREFLNNYYDSKADPPPTAESALISEKDLRRKKGEILKKLTEILKQRFKERNNKNTSYSGA
jgi:hypothetical protein